MDRKSNSYGLKLISYDIVLFLYQCKLFELDKTFPSILYNMAVVLVGIFVLHIYKTFDYLFIYEYFNEK